MGRSRSTSFAIKKATPEQELRMEQSLEELEDIYYIVKRDWKKSIGPNANPLEVALPLLDDTSVGLAHKLPEFQHLREKIYHGLRRAVNEHYDAFNNSIGSYGLLVQTIEDSQESADKVKSMLSSASKDIHDRSDLLNDLNQTSQRYNEILEILDAIEKLKNVPDEIEQAIVEKKFDDAYELISKSFKTAATFNLWSLSAFSGIKQYLEASETNLFETIIEELHNEIYFKDSKDSEIISSFIKDTFDFSNLEQYIYNASNLDISEKANSIGQRLSEFINDLPNLSKEYRVDYANSSFDYIYMLLKTASKLNKLYQALEILIHRHPSELHQLINRTTKESRMRYPSQIKAMDGLAKLDLNSSDLVLGISDLSVTVLQDFFWNTFVRCLLVLQCHRVVYEVSKSISESPSELKDKLHYDFMEIWRNLEIELHSLMFSYISEQKTFDDKSNKLMKSSKLAEKKGKENRLFRFEDISYDQTEMTSANLHNVLKDMFPGFITSDVETDGSPFIKSEVYTHQETLVPGNIFNMRIILESFLIFTEGAKKTFPDYNASVDISSKFFTSFMKKSFLPKMEESLDDMFTEKIDSAHSFELEILENKEHVFKNASEFQNLFTSICSAFNTSSSYRGEFSDIVLSLLRKFSEKYINFHQELLPNDDISLGNITRPKQITKWMKSNVSEISLQLLQGHIDLTSIGKEINLMLMEGSQIFNITKHDFLDPDTYDQSCYLLQTISWLLSWLPLMRRSASTSSDVEVDISPIDSLKSAWTFLSDGRSKLTAKQEYLTLSENRISEFDSIIKKFRNIMSNILLSLRYDLRCKAIYYIGQSFKEDSWNLSSNPTDCGQYINLFNKEVLYCDNKLNSVLDETEKAGILCGLPDFVDRILVLGADIVKVINNFGVKKVHFEIMILQQMLKNVMENPKKVDFSRSISYFDLVQPDANPIIEEVKAGKSKFNAQENKTLIRLGYSYIIYQPVVNGTPGTEITNKRKEYQDRIITLSNIYAGQMR